MADPNKRRAVLEKMIAAGQADSFAYYALGMEYRREGRIDDAVATFTTLREKDANYLPVYLMAGQMLLEHERAETASEWLRAGIELARSKGDMKALGELESALAGAS
ncbi:MAG TPA: tetratricopeptide repeat protein [Polyangiaceae bacterium]|nr:tetratricopeptide repeat protein [Polyangiaceae bacterium]